MSDDTAFDVPAGRVRSRLTAAGGRLKVRGDRLVFEPTSAASMMRAEPWQVHLTRIEEVATVGFSPLDLLSGGWRKRLVVVLDDGRRELFDVRKAAELAERLKAAAAALG